MGHRSALAQCVPPNRTQIVQQLIIACDKQKAQDLHVSDRCSTYSGFKLHILPKDHTYCHIRIGVQTKEGGPA